MHCWNKDRQTVCLPSELSSVGTWLERCRGRAQTSLPAGHTNTFTKQQILFLMKPQSDLEIARFSGFLHCITSWCGVLHKKNNATFFLLRSHLSGCTPKHMEAYPEIAGFLAHEVSGANNKDTATNRLCEPRLHCEWDTAWTVAIKQVRWELTVLWAA